jgi:MFS family permease
MRQLTTQLRSFDRPVQLLFVNQLTINIGFYMLMPYLATYLSRDLALATWLVGLVLGVRNLSQQGMFFVGGTFADRLGYKPLIVGGCALRTVGFLLLGFATSAPALIVASAITGLAGALFNPAVRAYLAHDAGERRVEAFALFNVFYQAGILIGPIIGVLLIGIAFRLTCVVAAGVFAGLTLLQLRSLPARSTGGDPERRESIRAGWRTVIVNRPFLLFSTAMIGAYVLSFQVYLALPLEVSRVAGGGPAGTLATGALFALSGVLAILWQVRLTDWCRDRWDRGTAMVVGLSLMGLAFAPLLVISLAGIEPQLPSAVVQAVGVIPVLAAGVLLTLGTLILYPFEMDTVVALSGNRLVATHYGLYSTVTGVGITAGNLLTGAAVDVSRVLGAPAVPWLVLCLLGLACAAAVHALRRRGLLTPGHEPTPKLAAAS